MLKSAPTYPVSLMRANKNLTVPVVETSPPLELTGGGGYTSPVFVSGAVVTAVGGGDGGGLGVPANGGGGDGGGGDGGGGDGAGVEPGVGFVDTGTLDVTVQAPL